MKTFTLMRILPWSVNMVVIAMLLISSCTSPQHFSFTAAPPAYQKKKTELVKPTPPTPALAAEETLTAGTTTAPIVLPEIAAAVKTKNLSIEKTTPAITAKAQTVAPKQKLTLAQKVVLKKLNKQVIKSTRNIKEAKDTMAGPVTNRSAFGIIIIGLIVALLGSILGNIFITLGVLLVLIGLILLVLNYM